MNDFDAIIRWRATHSTKWALESGPSLLLAGEGLTRTSLKLLRSVVDEASNRLASALP